MESAANHVRLSSNKRNLNGIWEGTASPIGTHTLAVVDLGQFTASDSVRTIVSFSCVRDGVTFFCCCSSCDPIVTFERRVDPSDNYPYFPNFSSVNGSFRSQHARLLHWISLSRYVRSRLRIIMPRRQIICNRIIPNWDFFDFTAYTVTSFGYIYDRLHPYMRRIIWSLGISAFSISTYKVYYLYFSV